MLGRAQPVAAETSRSGRRRHGPVISAGVQRVEREDPNQLRPAQGDATSGGGWGGMWRQARTASTALCAGEPSEPPATARLLQSSQRGRAHDREGGLTQKVPNAAGAPSCASLAQEKDTPSSRSASTAAQSMSMYVWVYAMVGRPTRSTHLRRQRGGTSLSWQASGTGRPGTWRPWPAQAVESPLTRRCQTSRWRGSLRKQAPQQGRAPASPKRWCRGASGRRSASESESSGQGLVVRNAERRTVRPRAALGP